MPIYACRTIAPSGALKERKIEAASELGARELLQGEGELVVQLRELTISAETRAVVTGGKRPPIDELASTIRQMSILVRAGVPLVEGLRSLAEQAKSDTLRVCLGQIAADVSQGAALSDAFAAYPNVFPVLAAEMAKIAEAGGSLAEAMARLAKHLETGADIRRKVRGALAYPIVVVCISVVTVLVMVTFILPRFMKLFTSMGAKVPWTTKALMTTSQILVERWYLYVAGVALAVFYIRRFARSPVGKRKLDSLALKLPLIGDVVSKIVVSRVLASMATLLSSGVPMVQALETSASAADNEVIKEALLTARKHVAEGRETSQALKASGIFPSLVVQMVASGEKTGELPTMLDHVCELYNQETDAKVKSLTSVIEPILIVLLGIVVGFIAISVIVPIYSLVGAVK